MNNAAQSNTAQAQSRTRRVKAGRDEAAAVTIDPVVTNTPPQHAERVARILKAKVKDVPQAAAQAAQPDVPEGGAQESAFDRLNAAYQDVMSQFSMPTWKRTVTAAVLSIAAASGCGYMIGQVLSALTIGVLAMTGSSFLAYVIVVLGCLVSFYVGMKVGNKVATYVMTQQIDRDIAAVKNKVFGWLSFGPKIEVRHA